MSEVADTFRRPSVFIESTAKSKQSQPQLTATANKKFNIVNQYEHITKKHKRCYEMLSLINVCTSNSLN